MTRLAVSKVHEDFSGTINRVAKKRERIILHRRGKDIAALVSLEDLALLEELEDRLDVEAALKVLNDLTDEVVPWEQAKTELDRA